MKKNLNCGDGVSSGRKETLVPRYVRPGPRPGRYSREVESLPGYSSATGTRVRRDAYASVAGEPSHHIAPYASLQSQSSSRSRAGSSVFAEAPIRNDEGVKFTRFCYVY